MSKAVSLVASAADEGPLSGSVWRLLSAVENMKLRRNGRADRKGSRCHRRRLVATSFS